MREWIEQYGEILLAGIACNMLLMIILGTELLSQIGSKVQMPVNEYKEYEDYSVFLELCRREKPEIIYNTEKHWYEGQIILIEEAFRGIDWNGNTLEVKVIDIKDRNGKTYIDTYQEERHQVIFSQAGTYIFELKVQDSERQSVIRRIELSVDNRKVEE